MELETGDNIMCTVDRIVGTIVFVKIDGTNKEGSITFSEISPGRIRNIRDFVTPKKKIICKVLKLSGDHIGLSLRRVTPKEQKEIREQYQQEQSYKNILKRISNQKRNQINNNKSKRINNYQKITGQRRCRNKIYLGRKIHNKNICKQFKRCR